MEFLVYNGKYFNDPRGLVSASSRGLRFGDGLFETMRAVNGEIELMNAHFARLWKGMETLQFKLPALFSAAGLQTEIRELLKKNGHDNTARVRLTIFRGDGGLFDPVDHSPNYIIQSWALPGDKDTWNSNGIVLGIYTQVKKSCDVLSNLKHNNFLPYSMAALHAKAEKWNDALLLNAYDRVCETSFANIFFIKTGTIYTPSLSEGCIAGVMRQHVIDKLKTLGYAIEETPITEDDLLLADEVFLTNSIFHIRWVQSIGDKQYSNGLTAKINSAIFPTNR